MSMSNGNTLVREHDSAAVNGSVADLLDFYYPVPMSSPKPAGDAVTVTELNQQTTAVLRRVKEGHVLPITERGKVIAYLTPPPPTVTGNPTIDRWIAEGRLACRCRTLPATTPASRTRSSPSGSVNRDLPRHLRGGQARAGRG
jgi:prevent-host-death family protein